MAKGAAKEGAMGRLHSKLATVFTRVLEDYERKLDANMAGAEIRDAVEEAMIDELAMDFEPNPAMLSAISKFLKDNEVMLDTEEVDKLNSQERRLKDRRDARIKAGLTLADVPPVAH